jgi:hypothetical protein
VLSSRSTDSVRRGVAQYESTGQRLPIYWQSDDSPAAGTARLVSLMPSGVENRRSNCSLPVVNRLGFRPVTSVPVWLGSVSCSPGAGLIRNPDRATALSPPLPLKFRRADFLRYGFKAGMSDGAFPSTTRSSRRAVCLHPSHPSLSASCSSFLSRGTRRFGAPPFEWVWPTLPPGPSFRFGLFCPDPSSLIRPHPPHSQAQPDFAAERLIPVAVAVCWSAATVLHLHWVPGEMAIFSPYNARTPPRRMRPTGQGKFRHPASS